MPAAQSVAEAPAIMALGPLFSITEVFLWDDAVVYFPEASVRHDASPEEPTSSSTTADANSNLKQAMYDYTSVEDLELAREMDALGLPISFSTAKEKRNGPTSQKKKGAQTKCVSAAKGIEDGVLGVSGIIEWEDVTSSSVFHDSTNMLASWRIGEGLCAASDCYLEEEHNKGDVHSDGESISILTTILSETVKEQHCVTLTDLITTSCVSKETIPDESCLVRNAEILESPFSLDAENCPRSVEDGTSGIGKKEVHLYNKQKEDTYLEGSSVSCILTNAKNDDIGIETSSCSLMNNHDQGYPDNSLSYEFGDWRVVWDSFYMRNYFYNCQTQESTWYPPQGLEHFAFACSTSDSKAVVDEATENAGTGFACDAIPVEDAHSSLDRADSFQENGDCVECIEQSSENISSTMDDATCISSSVVSRLATSVPAEHLDKHAEAREISVEQASPRLSDAKNYAIDEPDAHEYFTKQTESAISCEACNPLDLSFDVPIKASGLPETYTTTLADELDSHEIATLKKKKRPRRIKSFNKIFSATECEIMSDKVTGGVSMSILKYWCQRYLLFSRFDHGIRMDEEGWFSVTPESIARHHASRCGRSTVIDCFTGVGGNAIQFALRSNHVIAVDIDPQKIDYAQHNAAIYGVNNRIDFIKGDFFQMAPCLKGETVFMSPPWGGPDYVKVETYDITSMLKPHDGHYLFKIGRMIASRVVLFLPRNVDINQLAELALSVNPPWALEVEKNFLNGRLKAITAYFSQSGIQ